MMTNYRLGDLCLIGTDAQPNSDGIIVLASCPISMMPANGAPVAEGVWNYASYGYPNDPASETRYALYPEARYSIDSSEVRSALGVPDTAITLENDPAGDVMTYLGLDNMA